MTQLSILSGTERRRFECPPRFTSQERSLYFTVPRDVRLILNRIREPANRVGFLIQLGYFRAAGKFFSARLFRKRDVSHIYRQLELEPAEMDGYVDRIPRRHRQRILTMLKWSYLDAESYSMMRDTASRLVKDQEHPKDVFAALLDLCWRQRWVIPEYSVLAETISDCYTHVDRDHVENIKTFLDDVQREALDQLLARPKRGRRRESAFPITQLKRIDQSMQPLRIKESITHLKRFRDQYDLLSTLIERIGLTDKATRYYATWLNKADIQQLQQFPDRHKAYLHVLAFIKHQYFSRQDAAIDIFLKAVTATRNAANSRIRKAEGEQKRERDRAIQELRSAHLTATELASGIIAITRMEGAAPSEKYYKIESLVDEYLMAANSIENERIVSLDQALDRESRNVPYFEVLAGLSRRLQARVNGIVRVVQFDAFTPDKTLFEAINNFQSCEGQLRQTAPADFMSEAEKEYVFSGGSFNAPVYKVLLYFAMARAIKAGRLNVIHSYRYRSLDDYLIPIPEWNEHKSILLTETGLSAFADGEATLRRLRVRLDDRYWTVNEHIKDGTNRSIRKKVSGGWFAHTPRTDFDTESLISATLGEGGIVPILGLLRTVDDACHFTRAFKHHSTRHSKMKPSAETLMAGLIARGCNIGVNKLARISLGIKGHTLRNTVNWFFGLENLQKCNQAIVDMIGNLALANHYRADASEVHSSSDGRKLNVAVPSLHANYSFKYFGKDKGVTDYTYIDDRNALFHSQVFSASDREAAYVIDGLLGNYARDHQIHSTDTHGFTEIIFGACHLLGIDFAPRLAKLPQHRIYGFSAPATYRRKGYEIIPSRPINRKVILENWDDILRFMATMMTGRATASQLFKRLSSYAIDHPLYRAMKEFGRIIKSDFILDYLDSPSLRQNIQKQLNRVELANKFSAAVFFDNNQAFQTGALDEQRIASACKLIIQNSIVLWNYLYLSERVITTKENTERDQLVESIRRGSPLTWQHVNLRGEYDFTKHSAPPTPFDLAKIRRMVIH